jgi:hypothetical protein
MLGASELVLYNIKNENKILKDLALISDNEKKDRNHNHK